MTCKRNASCFPAVTDEWSSVRPRTYTTEHEFAKPGECDWPRCTTVQRRKIALLYRCEGVKITGMTNLYALQRARIPVPWHRTGPHQLQRHFSGSQRQGKRWLQ